jgi:hypothetical protein
VQVRKQCILGLMSEAHLSNLVVRLSTSGLARHLRDSR